MDISFSFAKRHQVLLDPVAPTVFYTADTDLTVFAEIRRVFGQGFNLEQVASDKFETLLTTFYQRDSSEEIGRAHV